MARERCEGQWRPPNPIIQASIIRGELGREGGEGGREEGGQGGLEKNEAG